MLAVRAFRAVMLLRSHGVVHLKEETREACRGMIPGRLAITMGSSNSQTRCGSPSGTSLA